MIFTWPGYSSSRSIAARDLVRDQGGALVVHLARDRRSLGSHARPASRRRARRRPGGGDLLQLAQPLHVLLQRVAAGAGTRSRAANRPSARSLPRPFAARPRCGGPPSHGRPPRARRGVGRCERPTWACGPSISWLTALPMSWSSAARARRLDRRAELGRDQAGELRALDQMVEDVLAVARAELELPEQLDELRIQPVNACLEHRPLALLDDSLVDLRSSPARRSPRSGPDGCARPRSAARA